MTYILGINLPMKSRCHESGVALIDMDGKVIFAANEERFSRKKLDGDFPEKSIAKMLEYTGIKKEEIKFVVVPSLTTAQKIFRFAEFMARERWGRLFKFSTYKIFWRIFLAEKNVSKIKNQEQEGFVMRYFWKDFLKENFPEARLVYVGHHLAHASGAYFTSPWNDALIVTIDGAGNLLTSVVAEGKNGSIRTVAQTFLPHSIGSFWGSITKVCGFRSGTMHGGKVTGLAASGDWRKLIDKMRKVIWCEGTCFKVQESLLFDETELVPSWVSYQPERLKNFLGEATCEDVAAAAQKRLEETVTELVKNAREKTGQKKIVVAGGVFANVLLNEAVLDLTEIDDIYIFPAMSDGGLALGAALYCLSEIKKNSGSVFLPKPLGTVYFGPDYSEKEIEECLRENGLKYKEMAEPAKEIAELINRNKVVAFYQGRMEYGPRALANRSILYAPVDVAVNDSLNKQLKRSEFMPFAPVTLFEHIKESYIGVTDDPLATKYMTITYQCTDKMKREAPACVHLDGTARPQVIKKEDNTYYYNILNEYYKLSGISSIINTSFNMHEEPIVCTPYDAIRAFLSAGLDYLVLEKFLCSFEENKSLANKI